MAELVSRAFTVVLAAFMLGLAVGWLAWRSGRRTVTQEDWDTSRERAAALQRQIAGAIEARDEQVRQVRRLRTEAARLQQALTTSWRERESLHERLVTLDRERDELRGRLEWAVAHERHLQRRVTELSLVAARGSPPLAAAGGAGGGRRVPGTTPASSGLPARAGVARPGVPARSEAGAQPASGPGASSSIAIGGVPARDSGSATSAQADVVPPREAGDPAVAAWRRRPSG